MKNLFSVLAALMFTATVAAGQYAQTDLSHPGTYGTSVPSVTIKGYLLDWPCADAHMSSLAHVAEGHPTDCSLKSAAKGLGMVYNGQWVPFDDKGSEKAVEVIKKAAATQGMMVSVTGVVKGDRFEVSRIKEIKPKG